MSSRGTSRSDPRGPRQPWWLGPAVVYLCMFAMILLFTVTLAPLGLAREPVVVIGSQWLTYAVPLLILYLHVHRYEGKKRFWPSVGVQRKGFAKSIVWALALWVIFTGILMIYSQTVSALTGASPEEEMYGYFEGTFPPGYFVYMFGAAFLPIAFSEELIFRGFTVDRLSVRGPAFGIIVGALMFTSLHTWYIGIEGGALLYGGLFLIAVWWGIAYWKTKNLAGPILVHWWYNASMSVRYFLGTQAVAAVSSGFFAAGMLCLGYLLFMYLRGLFTEIEQLVKGKGKV
ncbi:MAG: type II CAAX endopeptidase family protein [Hadesarchaea archaeon]|nr:type II CAAX endopeptidase family protein [Hadesarchaea archaeon]